MSATNRGAGRVANDFYGTPDWCTDAILRRLKLHKDTQILEPGCGTGAIMRTLRRHGYSDVVGIELDPERADIADALPADFLTMPVEAAFDVAIGNPPYSLAMEFVVRSLEWAPCSVQLLRLNWLSSKERMQFHIARPAHVHVLPKRPSFCVSITCKKKCGWHVSLDPQDKNRPMCCAACGAKVSAVTTDATEYAWFQWGGPGYVPGKWEILSV